LPASNKPRKGFLKQIQESNPKNPGERVLNNLKAEFPNKGNDNPTKKGRPNWQSMVRTITELFPQLMRGV
jgi:lauroyl/myristoyl acyltransferase